MEAVTIALAVLVPPENMNQLQLKDPHIGPVLQAKLEGKKPDQQSIQAASGSTKRLFQIWDQLAVKHDCLYRLYHHPARESEDHIWQLVIPMTKRNEVLQDLHEGVLGGHLGEEKTLSRIKERYYWPGYHSDVRNWCRTCANRAAKKTPAPKNQAPLTSVKVGEPLQVVAVDLLGPFPELENGNRYIMVVHQMDGSLRYKELRGNNSGTNTD